MNLISFGGNLCRKKRQIGTEDGPRTVELAPNQIFMKAKGFRRVAGSEMGILGLVVAAWVLLLLVLWLTLGALENRWELGIFLGRFHILILHLPIGLLFGVMAMEILRFIPSFQSFVRGSLPMLWLALLGGIGATILGFILMQADQFSGGFVTAHLWTGLGVVALTAATLAMRILELPQPVYLSGLSSAVIMTMISGHYGGNMVHGETYLTEFAPGRSEPGKAEVAELPVEAKPIYGHIIQPIFDAKCTECHYEGKIKGDLRMDSYEWLARGGENGPSFEPGDAEASELVFRVTIDEDDDEFMPPKGKTEPMTEGEIALLEWWINKGASPTMTIGEAEPDSEIRQVIDSFFSQEQQHASSPAHGIHPVVAISSPHR